MRVSRLSGTFKINTFFDVKKITNEVISFFSDRAKSMFEYLKASTEGSKEKVPEKLSDFANFLNFYAELERDRETDFNEEFKICVSELRKEVLRKQMDALSLELKQAEQSKDDNKVNTLLEEFKLLSEKLSGAKQTPVKQTQ